MGDVMVWNGRRKKQPAGGAVGSSGIYRPSFAVGRSPSEIVRARMAELGIGTRLKSGKLALNKGKKNKKAKSGRSAKACDIKGEKISEKEMQNLLARPKVIDKKKAERMAKLLKGKGAKKAGKAKAKPAKKTKPAGKKKPAAKKTKPKKAKKTTKKAVAKKPAAKKPAAKRGGKRGKRKGAQVVLASTMTKAREELERKLSKQGAQLAALQKKLAANGKRGKRRKNTKKANGSRKRSAAVAKRSGRRGSKSAKSATTTRSVSVAKKKKAKGRKRTKAKSSNKARKGKKKGARKSSRKPVAANKKRKGGKRKGGKKRNAGSMKMNNIWRALGITGAKSEDALVAKLRQSFQQKNRERLTAAQAARLDSQVRKALRKLASVTESEYEPSSPSVGDDPDAIDAALKSLIGLSDAPKKKKVAKRKHKLTKREAQAAAAKAAKGKTVKANKRKGKKRKNKAKRSNGKKRKVSLSGALNKAEKTLLAAIAGHDSKLARLLGKKGKKKGGKRKGSSKKSKSQEIAKRAAKSGKKGKSKAKKSNGKRKGKKRKNGAWASGGVNVTDFARNGIRDIVAKNFSDPVSGILVSVPGALVGAAAAHMFPRLVASEWFAKNALTRTLGAAIGGLLGVGVTSFVAGRLSAMGWIDEDQGVIQGGAAALGASVRTVGQLVTSLTDPTSKLRLLVGTDATSLADAVNMSDMIPQGRPMLPDGGVMQHNESQDALYEGAPTYGSGNYPDEMADFAMPSSGDIVGDTDGEMSDFAAPEMADFAMPAAGDMTGDTTGEMSDFAAPEMSDFAAPV